MGDDGDYYDKRKRSRVQKQAIWRLVKDQWKLFNGKIHVATVYNNGTWWLWDKDGTGGQNSKEENIYDAKVQAGGRAIMDGLI